MPGHFIYDCPQLKKASKKFKKKAMVATWNDINDSSSEEEENAEIANLCFMANEDKVISEFSNDFLFDELQEAFYELLNDLKKLGFKNKELKLKNESLIKEKNQLSSEKTILFLENQNLKK